MTKIETDDEITQKDKLYSELAHARTNTGETLLEVSQRAPLLLVFLRHFG